MRRPILLAFLLSLAAGACRREAPASDPQAAGAAPATAPVAEPFKPEAQGRKIRLTLIPVATVLRKEQAFRYRLELKNIGVETVEISASYFKNPFDILNTVEFYCEGPDRPERQVIPVLGGGAVVTEVSRAEYEQAMRKKADASPFLVVLRPGEVLSPKTKDGAAELPYLFWGLGKPGTYRIKAVFNDPPPPPPSAERLREFERRGIRPELQLQVHAEEASRALGRIESNVAVFEVLP